MLLGSQCTEFKDFWDVAALAIVAEIDPVDIVWRMKHELDLETKQASIVRPIAGRDLLFAAVLALDFFSSFFEKRHIKK